MPLKTAGQYEEGLRRLKLKVYLLGERIDNPVDHPIIRPSMNSVKMTYALARDPLHKDIMKQVQKTSNKSHAAIPQ